MSPNNRYNQQQNIIKPISPPTIRQMSAHESAVIQQYAAGPVVQVEQAFMAQEGADERTSGMDRSRSFLLRLAPLVALWAILGTLAAVVLVSMVRMDRTDSAMVGLLLFVLLTYRSYAGADERERYDSRNGVEHHRIDVAENLALKKLEGDQEIRREIIGSYLRQLENPKHE